MSLTEMHQQYPFDSEERSWGWNFPFEEAAKAGDEIHLHDDPVAYLDDLVETDHERALKINSSLIVLPPKAVVENYGEDVGVWAAVNTVISGHNDELKAELEHRGYDLPTLEIASHWEWRTRYKMFGKNVLKQYSTIDAIINKGALQEIDLEEVLTGAAQDGVEMTQRRLGEYALIPLQTKRWNTYYTGGSVEGWSDDVRPDLSYNMWLDSPVGFALTYKGLPNAMVGVAANGPNELMTYQLQGVKGRKIDPLLSRYDENRVVGTLNARGLAPIDWKKAAVGITEQLAHNLDFSSAGIQSAKNNVWTKKHMASDTEPHLPMDTAVRVYDDTAKRLGYRKTASDSKNNWHKPINY